MRDITDKIVTIEEAKVFIVPTGIMNVDGVDMLPIWIYNEDSDNFSDHGLRTTTVDGQSVHFAPGAFKSLLPVEIFNGKKEGEDVVINMMVRGTSSEGVQAMYGILLSLTLDQVSSRYARFGKFEEVLEQMTK